MLRITDDERKIGEYFAAASHDEDAFEFKERRLGHGRSVSAGAPARPAERERR
jgi:hypothetical protein